MKLLLSITTAFVMLVQYQPAISADTFMMNPDASSISSPSGTFPDLADRSGYEPVIENTNQTEPEIIPAVWPFGKNNAAETTEVKPKSSRKAFFLSFLLPGLGETYVGSKRGILFIGIEALSWWIYLTNTNEGNDLERDFQQFADTHWHYTDTQDSQGQDIDFNYWKWIQFQFRQVGLPDDIDPYDYKLVNSQLESTVQNSKSSIFGHSVHSLPSTKTQQYYEMIGKYPQFVYGWEDIDDTGINPTIRFEDGKVNYNEAITNIKSPLRNKYEDMRDDSNKKLKAGQRGVHIMILNRVFSAIHAARLAYHHNQKLNSELSLLDIQFTEKYIIDHKVPMIVMTKRF